MKTFAVRYGSAGFGYRIDIGGDEKPFPIEFVHAETYVENERGDLVFYDGVGDVNEVGRFASGTWIWVKEADTPATPRVKSN